jgi:superfamily II RNA helicase
VAVGRSGKRLALVFTRTHDGVTAMREDGRFGSFPLQRIGRVFAPAFSTRPEKSEQAFDEIHDRGDQLALPEPRLRDAQAGEADAIAIINDAIHALAPAELESSERENVVRALWSLQSEAAAIQNANRDIETLRREIWEPFERCARVLDHFGYLDFAKEKVTERGKWLADLRVDRPLLIGEALQRNLFASLDTTHAAALIAALAADEDRDYGELELDDDVVTSLARFEDIGFKVSAEEWNHGLEPAPELNFSAAGAAVRWASGTEWSQIVRETRAEEGDLFRMFSRTGEALLQVAGLRRSHPQAAQMAAAVAEMVLREPIR